MQGLLEEDGLLLPPKAFEPVWFGILPRHLARWTDNLGFPWIWDCLLENILSHEDVDVGEICQLSVNVPSDAVWVYDYSFIARVEHIPIARIGIDSVARSSREYWDSGVPLQAYKEDHILPEIVCWDAVPNDGVSFSHKFFYKVQYLDKPTMPG